MTRQQTGPVDRNPEEPIEPRSEAIRRRLREPVLRLLDRLGYHLVRKLPPGPPPGPEGIPDAECYRPFFRPWMHDATFQEIYSIVAPVTFVSIESCHTLWTLGQQVLPLQGDFLECGVYQGGTARLLAELLARKGPGRSLHLFDTFTGMPPSGPHDLHKEGDFHDTSLPRVRQCVGHADLVRYHPGRIPETFSGIGSIRIAFAHVDVDLYQAVRDCCAFIFPRLVPGGVIVFDDYGYATCPGARKAVDEFFAGKTELPLVLQGGQAVVFRSP
ncbi:MAG: TylF/MycF/NovP-related O-methyltransferase [Thermoanaerobaculia bacterium]